MRLTPPTGKINAEIAIPGSKSYTNRALIMASLSTGESVLSGISKSADTMILINVLCKLGVGISINRNEIKIKGNGGRFLPFDGTLNVGAAGTAMRFLTALCCLVPGCIILDGSSRMRQRPIADLVMTLRTLGAKITYLINEGFPPIKIKGGQIDGRHVKINSSLSSQFITALLLIGPVLPKGLQIQISGKPVSQSYIDMTIDGLMQFGITVTNHNYQQYTITQKQTYQKTRYHIEGDVTGANYFWALAAVNGGTVKVKNINPQTSQGDIKFLAILKKMGCIVTLDRQNQWIEVTGNENLQALQSDMTGLPDSAQTLAIVAAFAKGKTIITGLSTLRIKETDRIVAVQNELKKMGIKTESGDDWLLIHGGKPHGAIIDAYGDHRMAMSFAIAGAKIPGIEIKEPEVVNKSFPDFWEKIQETGIKIKENCD
ncbi:3-phosphoshikimate 1-carboxyvinyltransferase [Candidatus Roizmanbacteria bacterium RIFCSPHIGHO2_12_FULL_41_11]|uniref:3-phosphoshikimate 1-carboxyvinyltransferase n=2 Tax=Candidatus Roizmaniibacteriota TaxID=1752723 RepID=A0A1F7JQU9_9BACT|nr:MAG: 3-phosphoshikimate 1-carboxyvinyltransferase [Candidatus Roizmanbacteria bacterium RIFCSPHIGHO2_12_FULL_41_11]OGK57989.1 MAG: 3-phosphoshikimate 1-carboxyvinyltransferase [Candidatus Roizmanbacteria bacterium RIFCSPLOWO2_02_FULL_41_9]